MARKIVLVVGLAAACGSAGQGPAPGSSDGEPGAPDAGATALEPPPEVAADPGFAEELAELGWQPRRYTDDLALDGGDGAAPAAADVMAASALPPGARRDSLGGLAGSGLAAEATGFFHLARPAGSARAWLIDPEGNPFFAVGLNTVLRSANAPDVEAYLRRIPDFDRVAALEWDRLSDGADGGFGYGFNATPGFAETNDLAPGTPSPITKVAPYGIRLSVSVDPAAPYALRDADGAVLGADDAAAVLGDPWHPEHRALLAARWAAQVVPGDPRLIAYWLDNEIGLFDHPLHLPPGVRDLRRYLWTACPDGSTPEAPRCAPHALVGWLQARYGEPSALAAAWGVPLASFDDVLARRPTPGAGGERACDGACAADLQRFNRVLQRRMVKLWTQLVRELDPDHLVGSPRMMVAHRGEFCFHGASCAERFVDGRPVPTDDGAEYAPWRLFARNGPYGFDLVAINVYSRPDRRGWDEAWLQGGFHAIQRASGLSIFVTEFGVRARIDGWTNRGGAPAFVPRDAPGRQQELRGAFYQHDLAHLIRFRGVVGASFHRWADRFTAEDQMNMGVVHRDGARWAAFDVAIRAWNQGLYGRIAAATGL